jgi:type II secretory pathway component PulF
MVVHIVGFAASYPLYLWTPVAGVVAVVLTGVLPWIAVLLANAATRPRH